MALHIRAGFNLTDANYTLDVVETGGNTFTVSMTSGTHFLDITAAAASGDHSSLVTGYTSFLATLEAALDSGGAGGAGAYTCSFSTTTERVTIAHSGAASISAVSLTPTLRGTYIGQTGVKSGALSHEMQVAPYYWINGTIGYWARYAEYEAKEGTAYDVIAHSARPHGIARSVAPVHLDMTVPLEPLAVVYSHQAAAATPWTWQDLFAHCRNVEPLSIDDGSFIHYTRLREDGAAFVPKAISSDYIGHWDIPLRMRLLARETS